MASLAKEVKKILDLEFVEMSEVSSDVESVPVPEHPQPPGRMPITDISQWIERFSLMAATLTSRFTEKAPELFAYQVSIVRAERNYETGRWVAYDRQYRREALARKDLNWSVTDPHLYNEAFTGRTRSIPRCTFCLQDDHIGPQCRQGMAGMASDHHRAFHSGPRNASAASGTSPELGNLRSFQ